MRGVDRACELVATRRKDGLKNWVKVGRDKEASLSAKPAAECSHRPAGRECPFREHASTFFVPMQHHTGTSQCGSSLAISLWVSDEWHRSTFTVITISLSLSLTHLS